MKCKFEKWEIIKINKPPKIIKGYVEWNKRDKGWYLHPPRGKETGLLYYTSRGDNSMFIPKSMLGEEHFVSNSWISKNFKVYLHRVHKLANTGNSPFLSDTFTIPESLIEKTGKRILDVRALGYSGKIKAFMSLSMYSH